MRIEGPGRSQSVSSSRRARRNEGADGLFQPDDSGASERAAEAASSAPAGALDGLLALQAVEDPLFAKRKAVRRGRNILDVLEEMKVDVLAGEISDGRLNRLMALVQQARMQSTPGLDALLEEIELRARVELAKLGHFPSL